MDSSTKITNVTSISQQFHEKLDAFHSATSSLEKQNLLKEIIQFAKSSEEKLPIEHFLVNVFLHTNLSDNLKKTCSRMLLTMDKNVVTTTIAAQVQFYINKLRNAAKDESQKNRLQYQSSQIYDNVEEITDEQFVTILQGLLHNFRPGVEAISSIIDDVFLFAFDVFIRDVQTFNEDTAFPEMSQLKLYNSTKFLDALLRLCETSAFLQTKSITLSLESYKAIQHERIAFKTKAHCGALVVMAISQLPKDISEDTFDNLSNELHLSDIKMHESLIIAMLFNRSHCYTSQICIFSAIVNTCPLHVIAEQMVHETRTRVAIYIFENLLQLAMKRSNVAAEILEISRTFVTLSPLLLTFHAELLTNVMKAGWDYIWMHLDHFVDAVRNDTQKLLKTFIQITIDCKTSESVVDLTNPYMEMFTSALTEIINGSNPNVKALSHISASIKCQILLRIFPDLPRKLITSLSNSSIAQDVCLAYETLMEQHYSENSSTWMNVWVKPLIPFKHKELVMPFVLRIFSTAFKLDPQVFGLLPNIKEFSEQELRAYLSCIILARKHNLKMEQFSIFTKSQMEILITHKCAEIRILALKLIVECQKSTEFYTAEDFDMITLFFRFNSTSLMPNFRQNVTALFKKALNRYKESFYVIQRSMRCLQNVDERLKEPNHGKQLEKLENQHRIYRDFIDNLLYNHLIRGLYHQSEHGKRTMCLELMLYLKSCLSNEHFHDQWKHAEHIEILYSAFSDTYENNLITLRKLLMDINPAFAFPKLHLKQFDASLKRCVHNIAMEVKSNVVTSSTYELLVLLHAPQMRTLLQNTFGLDLSLIEAVDQSPVILVARELAIQIKVQLDIAERDVFVAAKHSPLYGPLFCFRHLIEDEKFDIFYPQFLPELIQQCLNVVNIAWPIVNANAPEGYNPSNIDYATTEVTPQLVLLYAWRLIKEVSLLCGALQINDVRVKAVFMRNSFIIESISRYFMKLFEEAKHRGAYEQGYVGFSRFVEKLWNSGCEWSMLPIQWLENTLQMISAKDVKICATRRSAGIPFMIQAILTTEPKHRGNASFHYSMRFLLKVVADFSEENRKCAVHGMNTLRALFRHNQLGEIVAEYVSEAMIIAIQQFSHIDWAVRNAATLMYSALKVRMFGVQRLKDNEKMSIKNRLSLKIFTTKYSHLYDFLFAQMDEIASEPTENISLYPILIILERLVLTFDAKKDEQKMLEHLHLILKASSRKIFKIRQLSIKTAIPFQKFLPLQKVTFAAKSNNQMHGLLLYLKELHHLGNKFGLNYFKSFIFMISEAGKTISHTNATLLMDILIIVIKTSEFQRYEHENYKKLLNCLHQQQDSSLSTCSRFQQTKFALYLHVILKLPRSRISKQIFIVEALFQALSSRNEDMNIFALNCIRYISTHQLDEPDESELEYDFVKILPAKMKIRINNIIYMNLIKRREFMDLFSIFRNRNALYALKVCQVLNNYPAIVYTIRPLAFPVKLSHQFILDYLCRQATSINSDLFVAIMGLIGNFVAGTDEILNIVNVIGHMEEFGSEDSTLDERLAIANFLFKNYSFLSNSMLSDESRGRLWNIYINLMLDDEFRARDFVHQISLRLLSEITAFPSDNMLANCSLMPDRINEEIIAKLPLFLGNDAAIKHYLNLCFQCEDREQDEDTTGIAVFDKSKPNIFKSSRPFAICARFNLRQILWQLDSDYSFVITKLLNFISEQEDTPDRVMCKRILTKMRTHLEDAKDITQIKEYYKRIFRKVVQNERLVNQKMTSCAAEVDEFVNSVLFTSWKE